MFNFSINKVGDFIINKAVCKKDEVQKIVVEGHLDIDSVPTVNCVTSGKFKFETKNEIVVFDIGCQTYQYPDRFVNTNEATITAMEDDSTFICISPNPQQSHFEHQMHTLNKDQDIVISQRHLLYLISGELQIGDKTITAPRAILAQTKDLLAKTISNVIAVEVWK